MKSFYKNLFSFSFFTLILQVLLLYPTVLCAMDSKVAAEVVEKIIGGVEKYYEDSVNSSLECTPANEQGSFNSFYSSKNLSSLSTEAGVPTASIQSIGQITALRIYCDYCLTSMINNEWLSTYTADALSRGADPELIKCFKEYWNEAKESLDVGDYPLIMSWIQILEYLQAGIEESMNPTFVYLKTGKLSKYWDLAAQAMLQTARYKAQFISSPIKIFKNSSSHANFYWTLDGGRLNTIRDLRSYALQVALIQADLEKNLMFQQSAEIVNAWENVIEQSESFTVLFTEYWKKAAEAWLSGNEEYNHVKTIY